MSTTIYHTCFYSWEEKTIQNRRWISEQLSNKVYFSNDSDNDIRYKFFLLSMGAPTLIALSRLFSRTVLLFSGSWIDSGKEKAELAWTREWRVWDAQKSSSPPSPKPSLERRNELISHHIQEELVDQIIKLVTLPLILIAMTFAALWGLISPLEGRKLYSDLEACSSIALSKEGRKSLWMLRMSNYSALCMQPVSVWEKENLYRDFSKSPWHDEYNQLFSLKTAGILDEEVAGQLLQWKEKIQTKQNAPFASTLGELKVEVERLKGKLQMYYPELSADQQPEIMSLDLATLTEEQIAKHAKELREFELAFIAHPLRQLKSECLEVNQAIISQDASLPAYREKQAHMVSVIKCFLDDYIKPISPLFQLKAANVLDTTIGGCLSKWEEKIDQRQKAPLATTPEQLKREVEELRQNITDCKTATTHIGSGIMLADLAINIESISKTMFLDLDKGEPLSSEKLAEYARVVRDYDLNLITRLLQQLHSQCLETHKTREQIREKNPSYDLRMLRKSRSSQDCWANCIDGVLKTNQFLASIINQFHSLKNAGVLDAGIAGCLSKWEKEIDQRQTAPYATSLKELKEKVDELRWNLEVCGKSRNMEVQHIFCEITQDKPPSQDKLTQYARKVRNHDLDFITCLLRELLSCCLELPQKTASSQEDPSELQELQRMQNNLADCIYMVLGKNPLIQGIHGFLNTLKTGGLDDEPIAKQLREWQKKAAQREQHPCAVSALELKTEVKRLLEKGNPKLREEVQRPDIMSLNPDQIEAFSPDELSRHVEELRNYKLSLTLHLLKDLRHHYYETKRNHRKLTAEQRLQHLNDENSCITWLNDLLNDSTV